MTNSTNDRHGMVGHKFLIAGRALQLVGWYQPDYLRAGDLIHVDADAMSTVVRTERHRGGTRIIHLTDGRQVCVAGEGDLAVFTAAPG